MEEKKNPHPDSGIEKILEHYGISREELSKLEPFSEVPNTPDTRKAYGIDHILRNSKSRKARIIIDYDADFPRIVVRIFSECSQKGDQGLEDQACANL